MEYDAHQQTTRVTIFGSQSCVQAPNIQQSTPLGSFQSQPATGDCYDFAKPATTSTHRQISSFACQQPLPQLIPSATIQLSCGPLAGNDPWHRHYYPNPSHGFPYPQSRGRYICSACSKAFTRPSSLRMHSHSHTGAKPFKCPQTGCSKAFSIRSNMKRHKRRCHSFHQ